MSSQPEITVGNSVQMIRFEGLDKGSHHDIFWHSHFLWPTTHWVDLRYQVILFGPRTKNCKYLTLKHTAFLRMRTFVLNLTTMN